MSPQRREIRSSYIEWAKLRSKARYNLAISDMVHFPLADLHPQLADLEISGADGYGYQPLLQKLSAKSGVPVECIVQAQGTSMANHLAMAALLEPGDEVLIEEPSYGAILSAAEYLGAKIRRFPRTFESGFQLDPREVERNISACARRTRSCAWWGKSRAAWERTCWWTRCTWKRVLIRRGRRPTCWGRISSPPAA